MLKLSKSVLVFLFFILCALPVPALSAFKSTFLVRPVSAIENHDETPISENSSAGKKRLAGLMPATTRRNNEHLISRLITDIDKNTKTKPVPSSSGSENPLKASKLELFAGISMMNLGYTEFGADGAWYDDEVGTLPGLLLGGTVYWPNWYASVELNAYSGDVRYRGLTQSFKSASLSGLPINSRSDANIFDTTAIAGHRFPAATLYGGIGYYFWRRNIRPTTINNGLTVSGLLEFYSWSYALLGVNIPIPGVESSHISLDVRAMRMLQANMEVNFLGYGRYDNANLNLGEGWGLRLALPWIVHSSSGGPTITIEPWYVRWNLNRSNAAGLTANGSSTGSAVVEPKSETRNFGISMYFKFLM